MVTWFTVNGHITHGHMVHMVHGHIHGHIVYGSQFVLLIRNDTAQSKITVSDRYTMNTYNVMV